MSAIKYLTTIFNACISSGYFPKKFKHAIMVFIPKPEKNLKYPVNYRPISLLEAPGKVLERLIIERFIWYLEDNDLYDENQYGYRSQRGAQQAIAVTWEQVATTLAANGSATLVLRDLEKAYDKVWHSGVKHRLLELRTPDLLLRILCNFLDGRTASIRMGDCIGPPFPLLSGVAQGSVVSPTLFVCYTSDTPRDPALVPHENYTALADDHTHILDHPTKRSRALTRTTVRSVVNRNRYERKKKIRNNIDKMKIIIPATVKPYPHRINRQTLPIAQEGKLLGLRLNN